MAKSVRGQKPIFSPSQKATEDVVETLNNLEGAEMGSMFYYTVASIFPT